MMTFTPSTRANAVTLRTYNRPLDESGSAFETWNQTVRRATYDHHVRLAETNGFSPNVLELEELMAYAVPRVTTVAGRTLWLGGTDYAFDRSCCQFNCSYSEIATVFDVVDVAWLLLNGCGVGFKPRVGTLRGFNSKIPEVVVISSERSSDYKGDPNNHETVIDGDGGCQWTIKVGDSSQAWAKAFGKLLQPPTCRVSKLVLDFSEVRGPGRRLKGYGWICNGYRPLAEAMSALCQILNRKAGELLDEIDILDLVNWLGTVLSSRRAAESALLDYSNPRAQEFGLAKKDYWLGNNQRRQSNNSFVFWTKPAKTILAEILYQADECGGDPGIVNGEGAIRKCPWFAGLNPCFEILLMSKGFCNLVSLAPYLLGKDFSALERAVYLIARANYRQTCVDLRDDVLQPAWHQTNESLRLCGTSMTGIVQLPWLTDYQIRRLRNSAITGAYSQADEWNLPRPKAVTTIKPEGTRTKASGSIEFGELGEGIHAPLGEFLFNWINFSVHDPLVDAHRVAGYRVLDNPSDSNNTLVCFPVHYRDVPTFTRVDGKRVNLESAVDQLERYFRWNVLWADHNVSCTVSYSPEEIPEIVDWVDRHWDKGFVSVCFLRRNDPMKTAKDLGHPYLPQEVVTSDQFRKYTSTLGPVDLSGVTGIYEIDGEECKGGVCPIK